MTLRPLLLSLALAAAPFGAVAEPMRILAFGDSLTEGYGLAPEVGLVPQLQHWLDARGYDVLVLNGGASGDTTADGAARIDATIRRGQPDAVIVELGGNDLLSGVSPRRAERNLDVILSRIGDRNLPALLVGIAGRERDEAQGRAWAEIWPRLARKHRALLLENLYEPFFTLPERELATVLQPDQVHASEAGVALIVEALGPSVEALIAETEARKPVAAGG